MKTATLAIAARPTITSTVGALSDRELLRETSKLVRHERHLQGAIIDHLAEIDARRLYLQRGFSSLFDYAVRELGYSDAAAARRIGAMRLCADAPQAREGLRDGSLTLSAAAELQWAFDRQRRRGSISGFASTVPAGSAPAGATAPDDPAADFAPAVPSSPPDPEPPLVLDAVGRQKLVEDAAGKSARQVRQMLADLDPELAPPAGPGAPARRRPLRAEGGHRRRLPTGTGATPQAALAPGPAHDDGATRRPPCAGGARPPRPEPVATSSAHRQPGGGGRIQARSGSEAAGRPGPRSRFCGAGRGDPRRHDSDAGVEAATDVDLRTFAEPAGSDGPPGRCQEETDRRRYSDGDVMRFGPHHSGGRETPSMAAGRKPLQLRRSADRTPLLLTTHDRDRPHPAAFDGRRRRSSEPQTPVRSPSPPPARAAWLTVPS